MKTAILQIHGSGFSVVGIIIVLAVIAVAGASFYAINYEQQPETFSPAGQDAPASEEPDSTITETGSVGALREAACPVPGPACPSPQTPVCHDGRWYCREHASAAAGARTSGVDELNFSTTEQLREAVCPEPALACEVPSIPVCRNGTWICVPPAKGIH